MNLDLTWDQVKTVVDSKALTVQWLDLSDRYLIHVVDGSFILQCFIHKTVESAFCTDFETNYKDVGNTSIQNTNAPFASKRAGKYKLYQRVHGLDYTFSATGTETIEFTVPYATCKITGLEVFGGELGDTCNFKVHDTSTGTITTVPYYMLNQFGFDVRIAAGQYRHESAYDADLIGDMRLRIEYTNNGTAAKTVGFNIILHELKLT